MCIGRVRTAKLWGSQSHTRIARLPVRIQNQIGELPEFTEASKELAVDSAGQFRNAIGAKKCLSVSIDHYTAWPERTFLRKPKIKNYSSSGKKYITRQVLSQIK